jgi:hypothetical protein
MQTRISREEVRSLAWAVAVGGVLAAADARRIDLPAAHFEACLGLNVGLFRFLRVLDR